MTPLPPIKLQLAPKYDPDFYPLSLFIQQYRVQLSATPKQELVRVSLERSEQAHQTLELMVFSDPKYYEWNKIYVERLIKSLLWIHGGYTLQISGPDYLTHYICQQYRSFGPRQVDLEFIERAYGRPFSIDVLSSEAIADSRSKSRAIGGHTQGCRIGIDVGGSVRKVAAIKDGEVVFTDARAWSPKQQSDLNYHYQELRDLLERALAHLPRVDRLGVSTAGIVVDNAIRVSSLFRKLPESKLPQAGRLFQDLANDLGIQHLVVANDGEVSALVGALEHGYTQVLGIAMGTSQGGGYVDAQAHVTDWLNELCFVPVDINPDAELDEWSKDYGVGVSYFSQDAVIKLARQAGWIFSSELNPAQKFAQIRNALDASDPIAEQIFTDIGSYLGYSLPFYREFYPAQKILLMGGVMAGLAGDIIIQQAERVLKAEFPDLARELQLLSLDSESLSVGLAIVAASLPT